MTRAIVENNNFKVTIHNEQAELSKICVLNELPDFEFKFLNAKKEIVPVFFYVELKNENIQNEIDMLGHQIVYGSINSLIIEAMKTVFEAVFIDKENPQEGFEGFLIDMAHPGFHNQYSGRSAEARYFRYNNAPHPVVTDAKMFLDAMQNEIQILSNGSYMNSTFRAANKRGRRQQGCFENSYDVNFVDDSLRCKINEISKNAFKVTFFVMYFNEAEADAEIKAVKENYKNLIEVSGIYRDKEVHLVNDAKVVYTALVMESNISNSTLNLHKAIVDTLANEVLSIVRSRVVSMKFLDFQVKKDLVDLTIEEVRS